MVETKFIVEMLLLIITLAIVVWWVYSNYGNVLQQFSDWLNELLMW